MQAKELRALQAPLKKQYRQEPKAARRTFHATGRLNPEHLTVRIESGHGRVKSGLHEAAGGDGSYACTGDMLLESLAACAGVTLEAVATAMGISIRRGRITAEGDIDFRGTLGVDKTVPVGITDIRLHFDFEADADPEKIETLMELTERYCVVFQTLKHPPEISLSYGRR